MNECIYCSRNHNEDQWCPKRVAEAIAQKGYFQPGLTTADKAFLRNDILLDLNYVELLEEHLATYEQFDIFR